MITYNPSEHGSKDNYKILTGCVIPRPIAYVTSKNRDGVLNGAPFSFFNIVSAKPPLVSISIGRRNGEVVKDTAKNILESKEFVIHLVDETYLEAVDISANEFPSSVSEVLETQLTPINSNKISVEGIKEAKVRFECKLVKSIPFGDEKELTTDLIIGEVVMIHLNEGIYDSDRKRINYNLIGRLAGSNYAKLGDVITIKRQK